MSIRRSSVAALVSAALLLPGVAACEPGGSTSTASSPGAADAKQVLVASTRELTNGNFRFEISGAGMDAEGTVHSPSRSARLNLSVGDGDGDPLKLDLVHIGADSWIKADLGALRELPGVEAFASDKYQHLDQSRVGAIEGLTFDFGNVDPAGSALLTEAVVDVRETGAGTYAGNIDLTRAPDAGLLDDTLLGELGASASKLPFEATLDGQARLTRLTVRLPAAGDTPARDLTVSYADYGAASAPTPPPAGQVVEAPQFVYDLFRTYNIFK